MESSREEELALRRNLGGDEIKLAGGPTHLTAVRKETRTLLAYILQTKLHRTKFLKWKFLPSGWQELYYIMLTSLSTDVLNFEV